MQYEVQIHNIQNWENLFADLRWAGFSAQMYMQITELSVKEKLAEEHEIPPIANVLLAPDICVPFLILIKVACWSMV